MVVSSADEVSKLTNKINLEITQAEVALNDTFTKLSESKEINYSQAQVYNDLKNELTNVIDVKIPSLLKNLIDAASPDDKEEVDKINQQFAKFESQQKPKLYNLVHLIAEKIVHVPQPSTIKKSVKAGVSISRKLIACGMLFQKMLKILRITSHV